MSIVNELNRLQQAKSDLATSIANKGVAVPAATTLDGYAALVDQIQAGGGKDLPQGAVEIEYLRTDGSAYINTGIKGTSLIAVVVEMVCLEDTGSSMKTVFGYWEDSSSYNGLIQVLTQSNKIVAPSGRNSFSLGVITSSTTLTQNVFYTFAITQTRTTTSNRIIYLFCRNNGSPGLFNNSIGIRRISIIQNSAMVRDYISVKKDGVGYMYDKVSKELFGNANSTGSFICGPDVT